MAGDFGKLSDCELTPLAKRHRIVAKVDQLMALVDELENQIEQTHTMSQYLLLAVVHELRCCTARIDIVVWI